MHELSDYHLNPVFSGVLKEKLYISYTLTLTKDKEGNKLNKNVRQSIVALLKDHSMSMTKQYNFLCFGMEPFFVPFKTKFHECLVGLYVAQCNSMVCLQALDDNLGI